MNAHPNRQAEIRCRTNGTVDIDFYRRRVRRLRRAAIAEFVKAVVKSAGTLVRPLIAVAVIAMAIATMPTDAPAPVGAVAMSSGATLLK